MKTHYLKTDPEPFDAIKEGIKTFEIRKDDRGYIVGDRLVLKRTHYSAKQMQDNGLPVQYTGKEAWVIVTHIMRGPIYGLAEGWVIMSIARIPPGLI